MSEEMQVMDTVVKISFEGATFAFKAATKSGMLVIKGLAKVIKCMINSGKKKKQHKEMEYLKNLCGEVGLDDIFKKDGQNIDFFFIRDEEYSKFVKMCEKQKICISKMEDFNPGDGLTYIAVGSNNVNAIKFNMETLTKEAIAKGRLKEGESVGQQCTAEDYAKSAPGKNDEEKIGNFLMLSDEMYKRKFPNEQQTPSEETKRQEESINRTMNKNKEIKSSFNEDEYDKYRVSKSGIVSEDADKILVQCGKEEFLSIDKKLVSVVNDKEIEIAAPKSVITNQGIELISSKNEDMKAVLNSEGVKRALEGREQRIKNKAKTTTARNHKAVKVNKIEVKKERK